MSRIKSRTQTDICGDCGASDPSWASINRGILLCAECCSVHRSLGRHVSQVKSLRQGKLSATILNLVNSLNAHGANSVWEHSLLDPDKAKSLRKKPTAKEQLHPNKAEFIRAKHLNSAFVLKPTASDGSDTAANLETELSKQLHASVRAPNLETSLRLLSQGADPNFYHEEKGGSTPLHVAAKSGQAAQVELLLVYGADIQVKDAQQQTAIDLAKKNNHVAIAERLNEAMYEVTDRLCYFLCNRRPNHATGEHIIIPDQTGVEISEQLKIARSKLLLIPNKMFEELVMDLYDEVDRRETEDIWATSALSPETGAVPFLPTNPYLSATRNQGRQKLARFSSSEFSGLLTDVLIDATRRQNLATLKPLHAAADKMTNLMSPNLQRCSNMSDDEPLYDAVASDDDYAALAPVAQQAFVNQSPVHARASTEEVDTLKKQLVESRNVISQLQSKIKKLSTENTELKSKMHSTSPGPRDSDVQLRNNGIETNGSLTDVISNNNGVGNEKMQMGSSNKRPVSMYEAREKPAGQLGSNDARPTASLYNMPKERDLTLNKQVEQQTNRVTRRIQELVTAMKNLNATDTLVPCADHIRSAITELCAIFPHSGARGDIEENVAYALKQLQANASQMRVHCVYLADQLSSGDPTETTLEEIRSCAYNLASANKDLVTRFRN